MIARRIGFAALAWLLALPAWAQMQPDSIANEPPEVTLFTPTPNQHVAVGVPMTMQATAFDIDDGIREVDFIVDGNTVATDFTDGYEATWTFTSSGNHTVAARAVDNRGKSTTTTVTVVANALPSASLGAPANNASFQRGATVSMTATATDSDGTIARVEFLVDGDVVGQDTVSPYAYGWSAVTGTHTVAARAVDNDGGTKTSAGVNIAVTWQQLPGDIARTYTYNSYEELCGVQEPETGVTLMGYDGAGNLAWSASGLATGTACSTDGNTAAILARKAVRTYDARNRVVTLAFPDANGNQAWTYTPDSLPDTVTTFNDGGASSVVNSYVYNKRRLLVGETQAQSDGPETWSIGYGYTNIGSQASVTYPGGLTVSYAPNALGQPTQVASATQTFASGISYFPNGALKQFTYGNGIVHTLTQNLRGLPAISRDANGSTAIHHDEYAYDQNGNVLAIIDGVSGNRGDRDMTYDALDRLTDTTSPMYGTTGAHYTYDTLDNVTSITAPGRSGTFAQSYCYDQFQRLTNVKNNGDCDTGNTILGVGFDPQGNLANWNGVLYAFDYGNRLRSIAGIDTYRYDAWGRRVRQSNTSGPIYSLYGRDGTLLWQRNERTGQRRNYVYLQGSLLAEDRLPLGGSTETITYQHTDALGTPVATTNASKAVLQTSEYEPYGKLLNRPMEDGPDFTGHVSDAGSKLVYMQQRYYDPRTGRFWSTDPVTAYEQPIASFNRYRYALNSPYHFTDPDGRNAVTAIGGVITEAWNAAHGRGFDTDMVLGALKDGYNGEGGGFASAAFQDATTLVPTGAILGAVGKIGLLVREAGLLTKTAEGATRIGAASLRGGALGRAEIATARTIGKQFLQNNGSRAFVTKTASGKFNVAIFGKGGYITSLRHLSEKSLLKQAAKYEWTIK